MQRWPFDVAKKIQFSLLLLFFLLTLRCFFVFNVVVESSIKLMNSRQFSCRYFFSKYINEDENTDAEQTKFQHTQSSTIYFLCVRYVFWFSVIGLQSHELECLALNLKSWFLFFSLVIIIIILICFISEHPPYLFWNERRGNNNKKH